MKRSERTKRQQYCKTLRLVLLGGILLLIGATIAILVSNMKRERVLEPQMREIMEHCEMDGLKNCEVVRVYDGATLVEFYVRGTSEEQAL